MTRRPRIAVNVQFMTVIASKMPFIGDVRSSTHKLATPAVRRDPISPFDPWQA